MNLGIDLPEIGSFIALLSKGIRWTYGKFSKKGKLRNLYFLIEKWFDEIDTTLEKGIDKSILQNKERKIYDYITDHNLNKIKLSFSESFRRKFLKFCGIEAGASSNIHLFEKYSRCHHGGMFVDMFWASLMGSFYQFYKGYREGKNYNYADIEMRIKCLKMYLKIKRK